jgi:glycosyltransferase involved in cell wall biosynthesis
VKVLLVNDYGVLAGGAERVTIALRDGLRARGHDARLFASTASPLPLPNLADYTCHGSNGLARPLLQVSNPFAVRALRRAIEDFRPDVLHVRMFLTQLSPGILPLLAGIPALLHVGNHQTICPVNSRVLPDGSRCTNRPGIACHTAGCVSLAGLARTILQLRAWERGRGVFRLIVANSRALAETLSENGVPVDVVIPNGTDLTPVRGAMAAVPTIAYAGRLVPLKGVDTLLHAMAIIVRQVPGTRLLLAGDGPDRARIERLCRELGLASSVTMLGHLERPRLDEAVGGAWVQAVPSRYLEPFANTVAEAMMRGVAVVATATGGTPEIVRDRVTGYLVPPADPEALAQRIVDVLSDRDAAAVMGAAARDIAIREMTVDRMLDRFEAAYARLLA